VNLLFLILDEATNTFLILSYGEIRPLIPFSYKSVFIGDNYGGNLILPQVCERASSASNVCFMRPFELLNPLRVSFNEIYIGNSNTELFGLLARRLTMVLLKLA